MPKTLTGARAEFEQALKTGLQAAAFAAYMTANVLDGGDEDDDPLISAHVQKSVTDAAQKFSDKFAELASKSVSLAVYNYVKEIGITMIPKGTLLSAGPGSPVTGTAQINDFVIT